MVSSNSSHGVYYSIGPSSPQQEWDNFESLLSWGLPVRDSQLCSSQLLCACLNPVPERAVPSLATHKSIKRQVGGKESLLYSDASPWGGGRPPVQASCPLTCRARASIGGGGLHAEQHSPGQFSLLSGHRGLTSTLLS